jgi:hypothetical protein
VIYNFSLRNKIYTATIIDCTLRKFEEIFLPSDFREKCKIDTGRKFENMAYSEIKWSLMQFVRNVNTELQKTLDRMIYIGPIREQPWRVYYSTGELTNDVGIHGENAAILLNAERNREGRKLSALQKDVTRWLSRFCMADSIKFKTLPESSGFLLRLKHPTSNLVSNIADHGFGLSQIFPVLVEGLRDYKNDSIILAEQPEIHLHPSTQAMLGDLFLEISQKKTIIVETHSDHIISRVMRRIAENERIKERVGIVLFRMTSHGTEIVELKMDKYGNALDWPEDFMEDFCFNGYRESIEQHKAMTKRLRVKKEGK